jgi:uracil-DNA glycosylase family 4
MNLQEARLRELGLWPRWELRRQPAASARHDCKADPDWEGLAQAAADCTRCDLHRGRRQAVLGTGDRHATWLFVGEGPGAEEDQKGEPFVGPAGKLLDNMLKALGLDRSHDVYVANAVKCRPPQNRTPTPEECAACFPFLQQQISWIEPKIIVALGKVAANTLLGADTAVGALRGRDLAVDGIPLVVTWHPAYLLRNPAGKSGAWEDLCRARKLLEKIQAG